MAVALIVLLVLAVVFLTALWVHYGPHNRYEIRIDMTGGSHCTVEARDWVVPVGQVHFVTKNPIPHRALDKGLQPLWTEANR